ncbi:MAG: hypothetical protein Udaeo2_22830 [Candidatus Udaeobacter sp.]|nr:MAG: hypothetical protein Udaeo2_22830 [Candidatus Udaeobacter sp.]
MPARLLEERRQAWGRRRMAVELHLFGILGTMLGLALIVWLREPARNESPSGLACGRRRHRLGR